MDGSTLSGEWIARAGLAPIASRRPAGERLSGPLRRLQLDTEAFGEPVHEVEVRRDVHDIEDRAIVEAGLAQREDVLASLAGDIDRQVMSELGDAASPAIERSAAPVRDDRVC
jgi:hypothetical protein